MSLEDDAKIGALARKLLHAASDFANMVAINAPTAVLARQVDEMEKVFKEMDSIAETGLHENALWSTISDPMQLMRLYEVLQHRQAQSSSSE